MQSNHREDAAGRQGCPSNQQHRQMRSDSGECLPRRLPQLRLTAPVAQERAAAGEKHGQWKSDEQSPKTDTRPYRVPIHDPLSGARRLVLQRLQVPNKQRQHEEGGRKDEQQFRGRNCPFSDIDKDFITQSIDARKRANTRYLASWRPSTFERPRLFAAVLIRMH
jgi:hypothetical protein